MKQTLFVIQELIAREMKRKYSRSKLGILWSVLNPLLSMAVLSLVFSTMFRKSIENYPVYYLTGYLIWSFFTTATNTAMTSLADNQALLLQVRLPKEIFPFSRVCTAFVNFLYSLAAYVVILVFFRIKLLVFVLKAPWMGAGIADAALVGLFHGINSFKSRFYHSIWSGKNEAQRRKEEKIYIFNHGNMIFIDLNKFRRKIMFQFWQSIFFVFILILALLQVRFTRSKEVEY